MWEDESVSTQEENSIVKDIVRVIMLLDHSKKPFKQSDITAHLSQKLGKNNFKKFLVDVKNSLNSLGLELVETNDTCANSYFLISKQRPLQLMHKYAPREEVSNRILLTLVLAYIFVKNGTVLSRDLLSHLRNLNIYNEQDDYHQYFGNVKKIVLNDFVEQLYLSSSELAESDLLELSWGQRAKLEVTEESIFNFVSQCAFNGVLRLEDIVSRTENESDDELDEDDFNIELLNLED